MSAKQVWKIVVAWVVEESRPVGEARVDLGERHKFETFQTGRACMWRNRGHQADLCKATHWCATENARDPSATRYVFKYETSERDPLGRARAEVVRIHVGEDGSVSNSIAH